MTIHVGALVGRIQALEKVAEVTQKSLKAVELKIANLTFANDDLKAQVQDLKIQLQSLSSKNKNLDAGVKKKSEEVKLKMDGLVQARKDVFEAR